MLSDEEKEKLEQEFQYALDNIVSKIKGETATAIVVSEQSMILLFKKLMFKIEKQSKEIEELKQEKEYLNCIIESDNDNYINKDKIKAEIEEQKNMRVDGEVFTTSVKYVIKILQSLLEKE